MATAFITGANRGLGLEFVKQLAARGEAVYAACRSPGEADDLKSVGGDVRVVELDAADPASVKSAADGVSGDLDLLVNNAGIYGPRGDGQSLGGCDAEELLKVMRTNVAGPLLVTQALAGKMADGAKLVNMTSGYGSVAMAGAGWPIFYCASKAALNMQTRIVAAELKKKGVTAIMMNPGHVETDMGGKGAPLQPEKSIGGMLTVIDGLTADDAGKFLDYRGKEVKF